MASSTTATTTTTATDGRRVLHWVIRSAKLESTTEFYGEVLGLSVARHEEFESGCEAACNGKGFDGAWSKTMLAGPRGERGGFAVEVTFNYGAAAYARGDGFRHLVVADPGGKRARAAAAWWARRGGFACPAVVGVGVSVTFDPDGNAIVLDATAPPSALDADGFGATRLSLNVSNLATSLEWYRTKLRGVVVTANAHVARVQLGDVGAPGPLIELVEENKDSFVSLGASQGRLAVSTRDGEPDAIAAAVGKDAVVHGPLALPPHHERVVVVRDPDGHEFAFVEASGYERCIDAGARAVDWEWRRRFVESKRAKVVT